MLTLATNREKKSKSLIWKKKNLNKKKRGGKRLKETRQNE